MKEMKIPISIGDKETLEVGYSDGLADFHNEEYLSTLCSPNAKIVYWLGFSFGNLGQDVQQMIEYLNEEDVDIKPKTEKIGANLEQLPYAALEAIGKIFAEGEKKYGYDNFQKGVDDVDFQRERLRHAIRHLMLYANGDRSENHLAKVAWFAIVQIWIESK